tara:strand:+ start:20197 stop:21057 length:861 start_codon:yes stop_codon:yes gene_type:complete
MKKFFLIFFILFFVVSCDSFNSGVEKEIKLDKNKILKDFKDKFSAVIPDDSLVSISTIKDSPIKGLKEGVILFKTLNETQQLTFFISNDGRYIIFQPQIYDFAGPTKNIDLMNSLNLKGIPRLGGNEGSIRIVEYSDFQCPACKFGAEQVKKLKNEYGDKISFYYKHYPLSFHKWADDAAYFTSCVNDTFGEKKFWESHDLIFENQEDFNEEGFNSIIKDIFSSVDFNFTSCLNAGDKYKKFVESSIEEGVNIGVRSTPTFVIEGHIVPGADYKKIKQAIDAFIQN